jgi:pyruvate, water dikinase
MLSRRRIEPDMVARMKFVRAFGELGLSDRLSVGGKGANLGELTRAGIRVPPGFVVTTDAFEEFLATAGGEDIRREIEALDAADLPAIQNTGARVRERIVKIAMPAKIESAIAAAHASLCDVGTHVAVRSSATSEDGDDASFAGLQDTYLWLAGRDAVVRHVRSCWASLYSTESVSYRRRLGMREEGLAMGVVVQRMVDARASGVMFTRSPHTGDRSLVVIEGSYGLGSAIVSGEVTPDKYVVSKVTGDIADRAVSEKTREHVPDPKGGVIERDVAADRQSQPCLSDDEITALATLAKKVERHYGRPQDIEWAIARGDGELFLLQSRPETVWAKKDGAPVAASKASGMEHVFSVLGRRS